MHEYYSKVSILKPYLIVELCVGWNLVTCFFFWKCTRIRGRILFQGGEDDETRSHHGAKIIELGQGAALWKDHEDHTVLCGSSPTPPYMGRIIRSRAKLEEE